mgnify:CR=1 FL=1
MNKGTLDKSSVRNKIMVQLVVLVVSMFLAVQSMAQGNEGSSGKSCWGPWQVSVKFGTQMSGIKDEDFIASNYAPLLNVTAGKWFSPSLALQIGYKGWYFNTIADTDKHPYGYYYGEALLNVNSLFRNYDDSGLWSLHLHAGTGYFYNGTYDQPNFCTDMGITNNFRISRMFLASLDVSAIVGYDIYQGDEDILPGISVGVSYQF